MVRPMKTAILFLGLLIHSITANASGVLECNSYKKSYKIAINSKRLTLTHFKSDQTTTWDLDDRGLYSYFAYDARGVQEGNVNTIQFLRLDLPEGKPVEAFEIGTKLLAELMIGEEIVSYDGAFEISNEHLRCERTN